MATQTSSLSVATMPNQRSRAQIHISVSVVQWCQHKLVGLQPYEHASLRHKLFTARQLRRSRCGHACVQQRAAVEQLECDTTAHGSQNSDWGRKKSERGPAPAHTLPQAA